MNYLLVLFSLLGQQGTSPSPTTPGYCLTLYINGNPSCLTLDPSIILIFGLNNRTATIKAIGGTGNGLTTVANEFYIATAGQTVFNVATTPATGSLMVYRNGIHQTPTVDYTLSGAVVTFTAAVPFNLGEIVLFDYQH